MQLEQSRKRAWGKAGMQMEKSSLMYPNTIFVTVFQLITAQLPICLMNVGGTKQRMQSRGLAEVSETFLPLNTVITF